MIFFIEKLLKDFVNFKTWKINFLLVLAYYLNHFHNAFFFTIFNLLTVICFIFFFFSKLHFFLHFLQSLSWCEIEFIPPTRFEFVSVMLRSLFHMHRKFKFRDLTIYQIFFLMIVNFDVENVTECGVWVRMASDYSEQSWTWNSGRDG